MQLYPVAQTSTTPSTCFYWDPEKHATVELTQLTEDQFLVKASKAYRLIKQDREGQEAWTRNISRLNDYLADKFSNFQLRLDYVNETTVDIATEKESLESQAEYAKQLIQKRKQQEQELESLKQSVDFSLEQFKGDLDEDLAHAQRKLDSLDQELSQTLQHLDDEKKYVNELQENGVSASITFRFSTDPVITRTSELEAEIRNKLDDVYESHARKIKQTLEGSQFKLYVEEIERPRVFHRLEHGALLNPEALELIQEQVEDPALSDKLNQLQKANASQYMAYSLEDITVDGVIKERAKSTPATAVSTLLRNLETVEPVVDVDEVPNDGPLFGTLSGRKQPVGFDPADLPHYYIVGASGFGKSFLKRVLVENVASLGYDVLSVSPSDTEEIGLSFPNPDHEKGTALSVDQYWFGDDRLLDKPEDIEELFTGLNAVTLADLPEPKKQDIVNDIFSRLAELDRSSRPLFVFLEEAHNFNKGDAADALQKLVRESRKFGIHIVVVSQSPTDFSHNHRHVRENTVFMFLRGKFTDYASDFLDDPNTITELKRGEAIIQSPEMSEIRINVRNTLSKPISPTDAEIDMIDSRLQAETPDLDLASQRTEGNELDIELSEDEEKLLDHIQYYKERYDERPSKSKCYREDNAPFGSSKTGRLLEKLQDRDIVMKETAERNGNEATVYDIVDNFETH